MSNPNNYHRSSVDWGEYSGVLIFFGFIVLIVIVSFWGNISSSLSGNGWDTHVATSCKDVTSYDRNWDNDMYCTRPDGSTFYTDYAGARQAIEKSENTSSASDESSGQVAAPPTEVKSNTTCEDVTTYDRNWDNDMYCTRPDGSTFYTDYAGARQAEAN